MRKFVLCILIFITLVCHGCLYLPIIYTKSPTGSVDPSFITIGVTTKEDVILRCGAPWTVLGVPGDRKEVTYQEVQDSVVLGDEKMITYRWETFAGTWIIVGPYTGAVGAVDRNTNLVIYFDENDIVKSYDMDRDTTIRPWLAK
jgi:hypothetical protein